VDMEYMDVDVNVEQNGVHAVQFAMGHLRTSETPEYVRLLSRYSYFP